MVKLLKNMAGLIKFILNKALSTGVAPGTGMDAVCVSSTRRRARAKGKEGHKTGVSYG